MTRHISNLSKAIDLLASARDLTAETKRYQWHVEPPLTFYLETEYAEVRITRAKESAINAAIKLRPAPVWKLTTDRDGAGLYIIAKRKPLIGNIGRARFHIALPHGIHISLRLRDCLLCLDDISPTIELPP